MASSNAPYNDALVDDQGILSRTWQQFFRIITAALDYLGSETPFPLLNNISSPADIAGLKFDKSFTSQVTVEYLIQRVTDLGELSEDGAFRLKYNPRAQTWTLTNGPTTAGITLTVLATGQVQYVSSNQAGTFSISRLVFRKRELAAKSNLYSKVG